MENLYLEVNLYEIEKNISIIRNLLGNKKLIAVVKGDAYGLGISAICDFLQYKVSIFGVSNLQEAIKVYNLGVKNEILILTPMMDKHYFDHDLIDKFTITIDNREILEFIPKDLSINAHIYVCTGMNRRGIKIDELHEFIRYIENNYININIKGIYTHLHNGYDVSYTLNQIKRFKECVSIYKGKYFIHMMNSRSFSNKVIREADDFSDGVRLGNLIYGYDGFNLGVKPVFNYYGRVVHSYKVKKGESIGYGNKVKLKKDQEVSIIEVGIIHHLGFYREFNKNFLYDVLKYIYRYFFKSYEIFKGNKGIKILGKPNMNLTLIDGSDLKVGDYVKINISPLLGDSQINKKYIIRE